MYKSINVYNNSMFLTVDIHHVLRRNYHNIAHAGDQESVRGEQYLGLTFVVVDLHHTQEKIKIFLLRKEIVKFYRSL